MQLSSTKNLCRIRVLSAVMLLVSVVVVIGGVRREVGVYFGGGWFVAVGNGCLQGGYNSERFTSRGEGPISPGLYWIGGWHTDWALAWRPFHAKDLWPPRQGTGGGGNGIRVPPLWDFAVVPLWPLVPVSAALLGWSHGALMALRRVRSKGCLVCGYDLSGVPEREGVQRCPECGARKRPGA